MADIKKGANEPFLYDDQTNRITGLKNSDATEKKFVYTDGSGGPVVITDTTASTSTTTGALTVTGGVGIGGAVNIGGAATVATNLTLSNGNLILGTAGNGISFAATADGSSAGVQATGYITRTATNVSNNDTVTVGSQTYTFKTTLTPANYEVLISPVDAAGSLLNLSRAINNSGGTPGTDYSVPAANTSATAGTIVGTVLPLTAIAVGTAAITLSDTAAELTVTGFAGGRNATGMSGELLSDYEEGTWNPVYFSSGGTLLCTMDVSNTSGRYTRVGNLVTVYANCATAYLNKDSATGVIRISGLPFTSAATAGGGLGGMAYAFGWTTNPLSAYVQPNNNFVRLNVRTTLGSDTSEVVPSNIANSTSSNSNVLIFTITYFAA